MRIVCAALLLVLASCGAAFADAGAPDPSFGSRGVVDLTKRSTETTTRSTGAAIVLPDGGLVVPSFVEVHRMKGGEQVSVRSRTAFLAWLDANGKTVRRSAPIALPVDVRSPDLVRAPDGHLLFVGTQLRAKSAAADALYLLRMSAEGVPEAAPGAVSAVTVVANRSMPRLALSPKGRVSVSDIHIAANGRVYVLLSQVRESKNGYQVVGYGPLVIVAIDPATGLANDYAGGGLVVAPATNSRSSRTVSMALDTAGRALVAVRESKRAIAGTSQDVRLLRYDTAGMPDASFAGGVVDIDGGVIDTAYGGTPSVAVLRNGDVLVRSDITVEQGRKLTTGIELARFLPTGEPAPGFGTSGRSMIVLNTTKSSDYGSSTSYSTSDGGGSGMPVLEQADGKLVIGVWSGYGFGPRQSPARRDLMRTTEAGVLDTGYEKQGFARIDVPWVGYSGAYAIGMDLHDRVIGMVWGYEAPGDTPAWVVRLLAGDRPAPPASLRMALDNRASCGVSSRRACFDPDGAASITGKLTVGGRPLKGGTVIVTVARPRSDRFGGESVRMPVARTGADGTFRLPITRQRVMPGPWTATARVIATPVSQRIDTTTPVHFTLGPRKDIATLRTIQRAQALATLIGYIVDDSMDQDARGNVKSQCTSIEDCFRPSPELQALVGTSMHPAPGKAGLRLGKPGTYTIVTRVDTTEFNLEFVYTEGATDWDQTCRGDAAARKRWCPDGSWHDWSSDPFIVAGVDGSPFDY